MQDIVTIINAPRDTSIAIWLRAFIIGGYSQVSDIPVDSC